MQVHSSGEKKIGDIWKNDSNWRNGQAPQEEQKTLEGGVLRIEIINGIINVDTHLDRSGRVWADFLEAAGINNPTKGEEEEAATATVFAFFPEEKETENILYKDCNIYVFEVN